MDIHRILGFGIKWNSLASASSAIGQLIIMLILARIVSPEELGLLTLALVWIRIAMPLLEMGFGNSIIQSQNLTSEQFSTLFWIQQGSALILSLLTYSIVGFAMTFFFEYEIIEDLIRIAAPLFLVAAPGLLHLALLKKELNFNRVAQVQVGGNVVEVLVAILLLLSLHSVVAIVYAIMAKYLAHTLLSLWLTRKSTLLKWRFSLVRTKSLIRFGIFDVGSQIINQFSGQVDKLVIGKFLGPTALGLYSLAWDIMITPLGRLTGIFNQTAFPVFSKIQNDTQTLGTTYHLINKSIYLIILPLFTLMALTSETFIITLFGPQWIEAAPLLTILLVAGVYKSISTTGYALVLARGKSHLAFYWNLCWTFSLSLILIFSILWIPKITTVAWCILLASLTIGWIWHYMVAKTGDIEYRTFFINIVMGLLYILPTIIAVFLLKAIPVDISPFMGLLTIGVIGMLVYSLLLYKFEKDFLVTIKNQFKK